MAGYSRLERNLIEAVQHIICDDVGRVTAIEGARWVLDRELGPRWELRFREDLADLRRERVA